VTKTGTPRAIGNTIHLPIDSFEVDASGQPTDDLTDEGLRTLVHEMGHVWQYQHRGLDYIPDALIAQLEAALTGGDRGAAYDWRILARTGAPLRALNAEQQADCFMHFNVALREIKAGKGRAEDYATVALAIRYVAELRATPGAPAPLASARRPSR
jgi:hypothetical protein